MKSENLATQLLDLNRLLDILEEANTHAHSIGTDQLNVNIRGYIAEAKRMVNYQLGKIAAAHVRNLHKAQTSGTS